MKTIAIEANFRLLWCHQEQRFYWQMNGEAPEHILDIENTSHYLFMKETWIDAKTGMAKNTLD